MDPNQNQEYAAYPRELHDPRQYYGPPDFRIAAINEAWLMFKGDMVTWVVGFLVLLVIVVCVHVPAQMYIVWRVASSNDPSAAKAFDVVAISALSGMATAVASGVLMAGYYRIAIQRIRMRYEGVGGMFNLNGQGLKVAAFTFLLSIPSMIITAVYTATAPQADGAQTVRELSAIIGPLMLYLGVICLLSLVLFPFTLTPLILVDQKLSIGEAAGKSWRAISPMYFRALVFYIVASLVASVGVFGCGIGVLFSAPLLPLMLAVVYRDHFIPPLAAAAPMPPID